MSRYEDKFPERYEHGIPLADLNDQLHFTRPGENVEKPTIYRLPELLAAEPMASYIEDHYFWTDKYGRHGSFDWDQNWIHLPADKFAHFTTDEICRLVWGGFIMSDLGEMMADNDRYRLFKKIRNCFWHWGTSYDYNLFVRAYNALRSFDFGVEGFDTYLDHTTWCNEQGYAQYGKRVKDGVVDRVFLDGVFAYQIHHKGELVMTIGFSPCRHGLLIKQVQLAKPKGNRWLYKLPCHYVEHTVNRLTAAFEGWRPMFIDGPMLAAAIRRSYGKNADKFTDEKFNHVAKVYSRRFEGWKRAGWTKIRQHRFHYLHPKAQPLASAA